MTYRKELAIQTKVVLIIVKHASSSVHFNGDFDMVAGVSQEFHLKPFSSKRLF